MQHLEGTLDAGLQQQAQRQAEWLKRGTADASRCLRCSWKPRKRYRKAAWHWLCCVHNQLSQYISKGLLHFEKPKDVSPDLWPRCSMHPDMGSDGIYIYHTSLLEHIYKYKTQLY